MRKRRLVFLVAFLIAASLACKNKYESAAIGKYEIESGIMVDSKLESESPVLILKSDHSFQMIFKQANIDGKWKAGDDGDRTWIKFYFNSLESEGVLGGDIHNIIKIWNPKDFNLTNLLSCSFIRI